MEITLAYLEAEREKLTKEYEVAFANVHAIRGAIMEIDGQIKDMKNPSAMVAPAESEPTNDNVMHNQ